MVCRSFADAECFSAEEFSANNAIREETKAQST